MLTGFRQQARLQTEIIALRHQLTVLQRTPYPKRLLLNRTDRCFWVWLSRFWSGWRSALIIVKPETVIGWHRRGFQWYWTWKIRHGRPGRPKVPRETRELIRTMSRENVIWGAPRIRSELLKLGIKISEASVAKYMVRHHKPPSQTCFGIEIGFTETSFGNRSRCWVSKKFSAPRGLHGNALTSSESSDR